MPEMIDPGHDSTRAVLRVLGPLLAGLGAIFMIVGFVDFFSAFGTFGPPTLFWCFLVGMPLVAAGAAMIKFGYMGKIARYMSEELTPVGTDTFNYAAGHVKDGVRDLSEAVAEGLRDANQTEAGTCPHCGHRNEPDSQFCSKCGRPLARAATCPKCGKLIAADGQFCSHCGTALPA